MKVESIISNDKAKRVYDAYQALVAKAGVSAYIFPKAHLHPTWGKIERGEMRSANSFSLDWKEAYPLCEGAALKDEDLADLILAAYAKPITTEPGSDVLYPEYVLGSAPLSELHYALRYGRTVADARSMGA